jgi:hypothetical protein
VTLVQVTCVELRKEGHNLNLALSGGDQDEESEFNRGDLVLPDLD